MSSPLDEEMAVELQETSRLLPPRPPQQQSQQSQSDRYPSRNNSGQPRRTPSTPNLNGKDDEEDNNGNALVFYFLLMLIMALGNRVFGRLQVYPMHNYPLFTNIILAAVYVPVCFAYIIFALNFTNYITKEQQEIPKYKFAVMGAYDSISSLLQTYAVNYIASASTVVLVQQSAIPISMMVSYVALNSRYTVTQYIGATIVMCGIVVVLIPSFMGTSQTDATGATVDASGQLMWIFVLVLSCVPMCLSSVYKEKALGEVEIDVTYLNGWVAVFQFFFAIPLCFPSAQVQNMPMSNIFPNIYEGLMCWGGHNSVTEENNPYGLPLDNCSTGPLFVTIYLIFNISYNFLIVVILKYGSANILWLASTMIVPLSNVVFSLKFIPGSKPMGPLDVVGLIVIMAGLVVYRFSSQMVELWEYFTGTSIDKEELRKRQSARRLAKKIESKQVKYVGLNQIESLQGVMDTRVMKEQMLVLFRSPKVIRENYLMKIGVNPSPLLGIDRSARGSYNSKAPFMKPARSLSMAEPKATSSSSVAAAAAAAAAAKASASPSVTRPTKERPG